MSVRSEGYEAPREAISILVKFEPSYWYNWVSTPSLAWKYKSLPDTVR